MFLSVCIPSYNRFEHLNKMLQSLQKAKSKEFDIIIVDNGSPLDINQEVKIVDNRIKIIKRENVVPGPTNVALALDYADGEFVLLCLDKDLILGEYLDTFIDQLKKHSGVACGYCVLNSKIENSKFEISENIEDNMFRCGHPSGTFFKRSYIVGESEKMGLLNPSAVYYNNPYLIDLFYARCLCRGKQARFTGKLMRTETAECAAKQKSYSYSETKRNIYFTPANRMKQFWVFVAQMEELELSQAACRQIMNRLLGQTMRNITLGYKEIMNDVAICAHHGIETVSINKRFQYCQLLKFLRMLQRRRIPEIGKVAWFGIIWLNTIKALTRVALKG